MVWGVGVVRIIFEEAIGENALHHVSLHHEGVGCLPCVWSEMLCIHCRSLFLTALPFRQLYPVKISCQQTRTRYLSRLSRLRNRLGSHEHACPSCLRCAKWPQIARDIAILLPRYPISRDTSQGRLALLQNGAIPPLGTQFHRCICAMPFFAAYRAISVRLPIETSTQEFLRYCRCWASKKICLALALHRLDLGCDSFITIVEAQPGEAEPVFPDVEKNPPLLAGEFATGMKVSAWPLEECAQNISLVHLWHNCCGMTESRGISGDSRSEDPRRARFLSFVTTKCKTHFATKLLLALFLSVEHIFLWIR